MKTPFGLASGHLEDLDLLFYDLPVPVPEPAHQITTMSGWLGSWLVGCSTPSAAKHQDHPAPVENVSPFCRSNLAPEQSLRAKGARSSQASIHGASLLRRQRRCVSDDMSHGGLTTTAVGSSLGQ
ncbi:hypothetical protein CPAR01_08771 [Colletotrichum paranaense]|uniref:Uncharacterized protein n=1 Tax=Colletotrichum paranaense TaxID=1914294 RepID=A0ABQ9SL56_9PEZI|nr:uncharacterized protein CPAR01_08771 [Colletotrichum paranaense]KAK1538658.1 hypothetical protein CPAR01_08771 [Colletotrichum paranaense]